MLRVLRLVVAFAVLPPLCGLLTYFLFPLISYWAGRDNAGLQDPDLFVARGITLIAALVTVFGAFPVVTSLMGRKAASWSNLLKAGFILGNAPVLLLTGMALVATAMHWFAGTLSEHLSPASEVLVGGLSIIVLGSMLGTVSAHVFWFIGIAGTDMDAARARSQA